MGRSREAEVKRLLDLTAHPFVDLGFELRREVTGEPLFTIGGRWELARQRFVGAPLRPHVQHLKESQFDAALALAAYMHARLAEVGAESLIQFPAGGDVAKEIARRDLARVGRPIFILFEGDRGSGKTHLCVLFQLMLAAALPKSRLWLIPHALPRRDELKIIVEEVCPAAWFDWTERDLTWQFINGSTIQCVTGDDDDAARAGGVECAAQNEAHLQRCGVYTTAQAAVRNVRGRPPGVLALAFNPPLKERGEWTIDLIEGVVQGKANGWHFHMDARRNSLLKPKLLDDIETAIRLVDPRAADADSRGIQQRIGIIAMPGFCAWPREKTVVDRDGKPHNGHVGRPPKIGWNEVTAAATRARLGALAPERGYPNVLGADFQMRPGCRATSFKLYERTDKRRVYYAERAILAGGGEEDLAEKIIDAGYAPAETLIVADSSGAWFGAERKPEKYSHNVLREYGFAVVVPAHGRAATKSKTGIPRNPDVEDNLMQLLELCEDDRFLVSPDEEWLIECCRKCRLVWDSGRVRLDDAEPGYSHLVDTVRYVPAFFEPKRGPRRTLTGNSTAREQVRGLRIFEDRG